MQSKGKDRIIDTNHMYYVEKIEARDVPIIMVDGVDLEGTM